MKTEILATNTKIQLACALAVRLRGDTSDVNLQWPENLLEFAEAERKILLMVSDDRGEVCSVALDGTVSVRDGETVETVLRALACILPHRFKQ
jgi:cobalamin biosynthesis protein CobT